MDERSNRRLGNLVQKMAAPGREFCEVRDARIPIKARSRRLPKPAGYIEADRFKHQSERACGLGAGHTLPRQAKLVEPPQHAVLGVADAKARRDEPAQILGPPRADAIPLGVRATQDQGFQRGQLTFVEPTRPTTLGSIAKPRDSFGVEADHPIPQRLAIHPRLTRRLLAAHAVAHVGQGDQSAGHPAVRLLARQAAQLLGRDVVADRDWCAHRFTSLHQLAARRIT
jgi:hypothetical protein